MTAELDPHPETSTDDPEAFVSRFARLWADPSEAAVHPLVTDDVVGHWPGMAEPVRGRDAYAGQIGAVLAALPDLRLTVTDHAERGDTVFISWRATATAADGEPLELAGIDRLRLRAGKVAENLIRFDPTALRLPAPEVSR